MRIAVDCKDWDRVVELATTKHGVADWWEDIQDKCEITRPAVEALHAACPIPYLATRRVCDRCSVQEVCVFLFETHKVALLQRLSTATTYYDIHLAMVYTAASTADIHRMSLDELMQRDAVRIVSRDYAKEIVRCMISSFVEVDPDVFAWFVAVSEIEYREQANLCCGVNAALVEAMWPDTVLEARCSFHIDDQFAVWEAFMAGGLLAPGQLFRHEYRRHVEGSANCDRRTLALALKYGFDANQRMDGRCELERLLEHSHMVYHSELVYEIARLTDVPAFGRVRFEDNEHLPNELRQEFRERRLKRQAEVLGLQPDLIREIIPYVPLHLRKVAARVASGTGKRIKAG